MLNESGFEFVRMCLKYIEENGLKEQGLYRNCGVTSKVQRLLQLALDKKKGDLDIFNNDCEWEVKTISSAVKTFLRSLPEPLVTFDLYNVFINAAKIEDSQQRIDEIHHNIYKLPEIHRKMLEIIICHLKKVADNSVDNLMTVSNLGVCFGPTLLRPREEKLEDIMDIKYCNKVVEVLINNYLKIFTTSPPRPRPPKMSTSMVKRNDGNPSASVMNKLPESETINKEKASTSVLSVRVRQFPSKGSDNLPVKVSSSPSLSALNNNGNYQLPRIIDKPETSSEKNQMQINTTLPTSSSNPRVQYAAPYNPNNKPTSINGKPAIRTQQLPASIQRIHPSRFPQKYTSLINPDAHYQPGRRVKTLYSCTADHETELSFGPGQIITNVYESKEEGWLVGTLNGKTGLIPANYVESLPGPQ